MMPDSIPFYLSDYMISKLKWLTFLQKLKNKQCVSTQITVKHMSFNSAKKRGGEYFCFLFIQNYDFKTSCSVYKTPTTTETTPASTNSVRLTYKNASLLSVAPAITMIPSTKQQIKQ